MALQMVTLWHPAEGYHRGAATAEYADLLDSDERFLDVAMHATGWEEIDGTDATKVSEFDVAVYQHQKTKSLLVDLSNSAHGLARVYVDGSHADCFMFTEYLRIRQQADAVTKSDDFSIIRKALISFVRHGHGTSTISEFGETKEERQNQVAATRALRERQQAQQTLKDLGSTAAG